MPYCLQPKCGAVVARGYCRKHAGLRRARPRTASSCLYNYRWQRRADRFRRLYPLCGMRPGGLAPVMSRCAAQDRATMTDCVDHVVPHRDDPSLFWDEQGNWQALCFACHARKTEAGL